MLNYKSTLLRVHRKNINHVLYVLKKCVILKEYSRYRQLENIYIDFCETFFFKSVNVLVVSGEYNFS
jgi:hypothetical protein